MRKKYFIVLLLILGFLVSGCNTDSKAEAKVVAEVNGDKVTQTELDQHVNLLKFIYETQFMGSKLDESKDKEIIEQLKEQAYQEVVLQKLLLQEAEKQDIKVEESEINDSLQGQDLEAILKDSGMEEKYFRQEMKTQILYWKLRDKVTSDIKVTEEEAQQYYYDNISQYTEPGGIQIAHILVKTEKEARNILAQLNKGVDFAELAREYSECPSKEQGGDLGIINEDSNFVAEFKEPALKLKPGQTTQDPVKTEFGYHIIKAGEKVESRTIPFSEVKNSVLTDLENQKKDKAFQDYLNDISDKADIKDMRK